ncbi:MAG: NAD(P)-dependent oxidoreductase [Leucobacter sp.]|nr:NAD(P)-dependent oxidoreductase [Leucobacter sp.]
MTTITVIGLGEAGRLYAEGLAGAGATVRGYDPFLTAGSDAFEQFDSLSAALDGSDLALSIVGARAAEAVAQQAAAAAPAPLLFADLNTASPEVKAAVGAGVAAAGLTPCDAAVMAPVPRAGHRTQLIASGPGAERLAELLAPFGSPVEAIGGEMGDAARVKLLRSVFMKGLATLVIETLDAAELSGQRERLAGQIAAELGPDGPALVERLVGGTYTHAERREHEVSDALAELQRIGAPHDMTAASLAWFRRILAG